MRGWAELKRTLLDGVGDGRPLVLGLDFDGTLSPLVRRPSRARLPGKTRRLLASLRRGKAVRLAIISGRSLPDIMSKVGIPGIYYSGNHGLVMRGPGVAWCHPQARAASKRIQHLAKALSPALRAFPGALLEDKGLTMTIHYRGVQREDADVLGGFLKRVVEGRRGLVLAAGKKSWEIRPHLAWNKGHALSRIARIAAPGGRMMFIGDDRTDEDGFRELGRRAVTIRVGPALKSAAQFYLPRQTQVHQFLKILCEMLPDRPCRSRSTGR
ncbi:MAG: trehalose-phosphatase [Elusimicrobia bacterium GWA2_69_24]|nr:MAG: trehalose-phosphatase [Elusimicrobia bacterium GWA2_69_24]